MTDPFSLELEASHLSLRDIGPWLATVFDASGIGESSSRVSIELAIHELAANSVDHAQPADGRLRLCAAVTGDQLVVGLTDRGKPFDPERKTTPDENRPQVRGYGMMIIEQIATSLDYSRLDEENIWSAHFVVDSS